MKPNSHRINCLARQMLVKTGQKPDGKSLYTVQLMSWYLEDSDRKVPAPIRSRLQHLAKTTMADAYRTLTAIWESNGPGALLADELLDKRPAEFACALLDSLEAGAISDPPARPSRKIAIGKSPRSPDGESLTPGPLQ